MHLPPIPPPLSLYLTPIPPQTGRQSHARFFLPKRLPGTNLLGALQQRQVRIKPL